MSSTTTFLGVVALKSAGFLLCGFAAAWAARGASASFRSFIWFCVLCLLIILPAFHSFGPRLELTWLSTVRPARPAVILEKNGDRPGTQAHSEPSAAATRRSAIPYCWGLGTMAVASYFLAGYIGLRGWRRGARPVEWLSCDVSTDHGRTEVSVFASPDCKIPITWGWWKPVMLFPEEAREWPVSRRRHVLLHELAHVRRADWSAQIFIQSVCAIYWWNPLVWLAARRWRFAAEQACDDLALADGAQPSAYAADLLAIAKEWGGVAHGTSFACALAQRPPLDRRVRSILDSATRRAPISFASKMALLLTGVTTALVVSGLSVAHAQAEQPPDQPVRAPEKGAAEIQPFGNPNEAFLAAYTNFDKAEKLEKSGKSSEALLLYEKTHRALKEIGARWPSWKPSILTYRLRKTEEAIERIHAKGKPDITSTNSEGGRQNGLA